jgi:hypothetical protein
MKIKDSTVKISGICTELAIALLMANEVYQKYGHEMVITSIKDGKHMDGSKHYIGAGADLRIKNFNRVPTVMAVMDEIREKVGADFDVVLESDHIHIEFDPK